MKRVYLWEWLATLAIVTPVACSGELREPEATTERNWKAEAGADYYSTYLFRGVDISKHHPLAQTRLLLEYKRFTAAYTGYYSPVDQPGLKWYTEHNYTLDYTATWEQFSLTAGAQYYQYPNGRSGVDTWDLYGVLAYDFPLLNPRATLNWDVDEFHTGYATVGLSHEFDLSKPACLPEPGMLTLTPSAALGIDLGYNSRKTQANLNWNDVLLGLTVNLAVTRNISLHTGVLASFALDSLHEINQGNEVIGNFGVVVTF